MDDEFYERLESAKRNSTGQLLLRCARLFNQRALERVRTETGVRVRPAHTALLPHIDLEGTRLTTLAGRVGVSRQAVAKQVRELERHGLLERMPDSDDGRANLVCFSESGREMLLEGLQVLGRVEGEVANELGPARMQLLRRTLADMVRFLED
ncbi:MAG: MarR family transcriptional regulator [Proteobacteria bacterium]|nr:MarR family transcriptional regulator [Pseudomonadota bacterium]